MTDVIQVIFEARKSGKRICFNLDDASSGHLKCQEDLEDTVFFL